MKDKKPVFCVKCKYSRGIRFGGAGIEECHHPENCDTYNNYARPYKQYLNDPRDLNKNNDCKWYTPRLKILTTIVKFFKTRSQE
jgi:hypothetical protein